MSEKHRRKPRRGSTGIYVEGGHIDRQAVDAAAKGIERVMRSGHTYHADQETTRHALEVLRSIGGVSDVAITNCNLHMEG